MKLYRLQKKPNYQLTILTLIVQQKLCMKKAQFYITKVLLSRSGKTISLYSQNITALTFITNQIYMIMQLISEKSLRSWSLQVMQTNASSAKRNLRLKTLNMLIIQILKSMMNQNIMFSVQTVRILQGVSLKTFGGN